MPKLIIDHREIEVDSGTKVIEAAEQLGIMIPRFCYHPALGSVGACRVCAVKFLEGPFKGIQMSCMIEAQDGMVVSTTDEEAVDFRKHVIEWLMLNHPHDCPVCDEGGHCLLQDMTIAGGHGLRRFEGNKRTYTDQYLGPLLQHEMNRCIHCYRCSRYYQEYSGYLDLGVMRSANRTYFGRFKDGVLESPFSGNLSDLCPTGVYTDKPSRFFGRRWDYQRSPAICINCSLGCHTVISFRYREARRQEARHSRAVNGYFICDRGRYGHFYNGLESRPRSALIGSREATVKEALAEIHKQLDRIRRDTGASAVAAVGSARSSLETQSMLTHFCRMNNAEDPIFFVDQALAVKVKSAVARLEPELALSLREIENSDCILLMGADPINEAPMLALALRQAHRNGATVVVLDPRPVSLPLDFIHLPVALNELGFYAGLLVKAAVDQAAAAALGEPAAQFFAAAPDENLADETYREQIAAVAHSLRNSRQTVVVCGTDIVPPQVPGLAADLALLLRAADKEAGLFYIMPGANAFGAGLASDPERSFLQIIEGIENSEIKALILAECDPFSDFRDHSRLDRAIGQLELLVVMDHLNTGTMRRAHIFLPTSTFYEAGGIFVNQEGRLQVAGPAYEGGVPIVRSGGGHHPPRIYGTGIPAAEPRPAWQLLADLADADARPDVDRHLLADIIPEIADLPSWDDLPDDGVRLQASADTDLRFKGRNACAIAKDGGGDDRLELLLVDGTFGTEELSARSACLQELVPQPTLSMHAGEAKRLNLVEGDLISITTDGGKLEAKLKTAANMAPGVIVVPRHRKLSWQIFEPGPVRISREHIKKIG
ncbi:MAG: NADH-quinone oxidoreductase subunit NuoG [Deltaproteobacteria bacterium]|jgi:NADH-quinone oxidoreductase subunit G|nr:NADH-quinone oxidoreductase subunit NuoG [Deltaproteobacteria bacterium]